MNEFAIRDSINTWICDQIINDQITNNKFPNNKFYFEEIRLILQKSKSTSFFQILHFIYVLITVSINVTAQC